MREILFRGKNADTGEWVYGAFIPDLLEVYQGDTQLDGFIKPFGRTKEERQMVEVERKTVGQFTGLTDKNGKKIFEGDIVEYGVGSSENKIGAVIFDGCGFMVENDGCFLCVYSEQSDYLNIIGNVFDNPELLRGEL